jgi:hypothetical protein
MGVCISPQGCLLSAVDSVWGGFADGIRSAAGEALTQLFGWWTGTSSASVNDAVVHRPARALRPGPNRWAGRLGRSRPRRGR